MYNKTDIASTLVKYDIIGTQKGGALHMPIPQEREINMCHVNWPIICHIEHIPNITIFSTISDTPQLTDIDMVGVTLMGFIRKVLKMFFINSSENDYESILFMVVYCIC